MEGGDEAAEKTEGYRSLTKEEVEELKALHSGKFFRGGGEEGGKGGGRYERNIPKGLSFPCCGYQNKSTIQGIKTQAVQA